MGLKGWLNERKSAVEASIHRYKNQDFLDGVIAGCFLVAYADGSIDASEKQKMVQFIQRNEDLQHFSAADVISRFNQLSDDFEFSVEIGKANALHKIGKLKNDQEAARLLVRVCCAIGLADGDFDDDEKAIVRTICRDLSLDPDTFLPSELGTTAPQTNTATTTETTATAVPTPPSPPVTEKIKEVKEVDTVASSEKPPIFTKPDGTALADEQRIFINHPQVSVRLHTTATQAEFYMASVSKTGEQSCVAVTQAEHHINIAALDHVWFICHSHAKLAQQAVCLVVTVEENKHFLVDYTPHSGNSCCLVRFDTTNPIGIQLVSMREESQHADTAALLPWVMQYK